LQAIPAQFLRDFLRLPLVAIATSLPLTQDAMSCCSPLYPLRGLAARDDIYLFSNQIATEVREA